MALISLPTAPLGDTFARAGLALLQRGANTVLDFGWDSLTGMLVDEPVDAMVGATTVQGRRKLFHAAAADISSEISSVQDGQSCTAAGVAYRVVTPITRDVTGGWVTFELERA